MPRPLDREGTFGSIVVAGAAGATYALLCPAVSGMGDGSEFTLVLATGGVPHPTGYPLYTLGGQAFGAGLHAVGVPWPLAANLWSATGAAIAVGFLFALAHRLVSSIPDTDRPTRLLAALLPTALFALQPILLIDAAAAEVNAWSAAWACAAAFVFVRLMERIDAGTPDLRGPAALWGLVCGAGLAHHLTSVLLSVPFTVALAILVARRGRAAMALVLIAVLAAGAPLASYAFVAWRAWHPALVQWPALEPSLAGVWRHVSGDQYRHYLGYFAPAEDQRALIEQVALPFLAAGAVALAANLVRSGAGRARATWAAFAAGAVLVTAFTFRYGVPDPAPYLLPAMAIAAATAAPALAGLLRPRGRARVLRWGLAVLGVVAISVPWVRDADARRDDIAGYERLIRSMWSAVPADTAIVFWPDDRYLRLREYQLFRAEKPAVLVLNPNLLLDDRVRARLQARFGADPLAGHPPPSIEPGSPGEAQRIHAYFRGVLRDFNRRIRTPVVIFDPSVPIVQQLRKPWENAPSPP